MPAFQQVAQGPSDGGLGARRSPENQRIRILFNYLMSGMAGEEPPETRPTVANPPPITRHRTATRPPSDRPSTAIGRHPTARRMPSPRLARLDVLG